MNQDYFEVMDAERVLREKMEWMRWAEEIPYIQWPAAWQVKAIPPFMGAVIRYHIRRDDTPEDIRVSVYLDCYSSLGFMDTPYWEVYPGNEDGDTERCLMEETDILLDQIRGGLRYLAS